MRKRIAFSKMTSLKVLRRLRLPMVVIGLAVLLASTTHASRMPGSTPIEDLELTLDWQVEVDGQPSASRVFYSRYEVAWLLEIPVHGSLLLSPRGSSVQRVGGDPLQIEGGRASLVPAAVGQKVAAFTREGVVRAFKLDGHVFALRPADPLLGRQSSFAVGARHPEYERQAVKYQPSVENLSSPVSQDAVAESMTVRVYFGSWSPICRRIVPKIMAVEETWGDVRFEYYGLPERLIDDPHAVEMGITGVPTVVMLEDGREIERLTGRQLDKPAQILKEAIVRQ